MRQPYDYSKIRLASTPDIIDPLTFSAVRAISTIGSMAIKHRPAQRENSMSTDNQRRERPPPPTPATPIDLACGEATSRPENAARADQCRWWARHRYHNSRINPGATIRPILEPNEGGNIGNGALYAKFFTGEMANGIEAALLRETNAKVKTGPNHSEITRWIITAEDQQDGVHDKHHENHLRCNRRR